MTNLFNKIYEKQKKKKKYIINFKKNKNNFIININN